MSEAIQYTIVSIILIAILVFLLYKARKALRPRKKKNGVNPKCAGCIVAKSCRKPVAAGHDVK